MVDSDPRIYCVDRRLRLPKYSADAEPTDLELRFVDEVRLQEKCKVKEGEIYWEVWDRMACFTPAERVVWDRLSKWDRV